MEILFGKQKLLEAPYTLQSEQLLSLVSEKLGLETNEFYLISNGRRVTNETNLFQKVHICLKTPGGKGGFGSMLRAIGAQIEKTTNREACRDLSGRRLRDINEEQRLKKWVAEQAEREKEAKERKKKKLEKLLEQPKHTFVDQEYDKERSSLPEKVEDAVLKGIEASCSNKRKSDGSKGKTIKKKAKLWVDSDLEDLSSSDSENEDEESKPSNENLQLHSEGTVAEDLAKSSTEVTKQNNLEDPTIVEEQPEENEQLETPSSSGVKTIPNKT